MWTDGFSSHFTDVLLNYYVVFNHLMYSFVRFVGIMPLRLDYLKSGSYSTYCILLIYCPCIFGRPFVKRFVLCYQTVACLSVCPVLGCLSCLSVTLVYCGQTVGWIKMNLDIAIGLGPAYCVTWGPSSPPQTGHSPRLSAHVCSGQTAGWIKVPLGTEVAGRPRPRAQTTLC